VVRLIAASLSRNYSSGRVCSTSSQLLLLALSPIRGGLGTKPKSPLGGASKSSSSLQSTASTSASSNSSGEQVPADGEQPLTKAYIEAYGINWQGYLRFGLTPRYLLDVLFKLGLGVQTVGGRLKIFKEEKIRYVIQSSAFGEIALVLVRVSTGALSVFIGEE
jgi:hypothetical protein